MNKRIKSTLLGAIAAIGLINLLVIGSDEQKPYAIKNGLKTVLIPGAASIWDHFTCPLNVYKKFYASKYKHFYALNNIPIFDSTDKVVVMTLGEMREAFHPEENEPFNSKDNNHSYLNP